MSTMPSPPASWSRAAELWEDFPQPYEAAYCHFRQGEALIARGRLHEGLAVLDQSAVVADRLGARPVARMIQAVRASTDP